MLPIIAPSLVDIGLFGFTLSWDEVARSSQAFGSDQNTLPLELTGLTTTITNPEIYALGRLAGLARFLDHVAKHDRVWICRRLDIAKHWAATHPYRDP